MPAQAAHFDVIYADHYDLHYCYGCMSSLEGTDFALLVNKGLTNIEEREFCDTRFTVETSVPDLEIVPFVNCFHPPVTPILPNQALGSTGGLGSELLPSLLLPGETYHNTSPLQVIAFTIYRKGTYAGPVTSHVTMRVGGEVASFTLHFDLQDGGFDIQFLSVARTSSQVPTPAARTTWSKVKAIYR